MKCSPEYRRRPCRARRLRARSRQRAARWRRACSRSLPAATRRAAAAARGPRHPGRCLRSWCLRDRCRFAWGVIYIQEGCEESVRVFDTEEEESAERIGPPRHGDTENLCVSVSLWLLCPLKTHGDSVNSSIGFGEFEFDAASGELRRGAENVRLEPQPARVLAVLLEHAGDVV